MPKLSGACFGGQVRFTIALDDDEERAERQAFFQGYCACTDCRRAHGASLVDGVCIFLSLLDEDSQRQLPSALEPRQVYHPRSSTLRMRLLRRAVSSQ